MKQSKSAQLMKSSGIILSLVLFKQQSRNWKLDTTEECFLFKCTI